ncbi:FAD-dependent oxidoreductase [Roseovarius arcticus]|uniref:FAD-dependent oxidoreductase n=1 Tax=Roseovarius arcticus TaxID=2547404 RepID=UPI001110EE3B|nr:FAD-dependent oxidoreductase [Roseovarius arcticus]
MLRHMDAHAISTGDLAALDGRVFDVVIIGGGIIGASSAREAAAAGYSVLLAEKNDFASGSTSRSSRLLHCGLRYFEAPQPVRYFTRHPSRFLTSLRMARAAMRERREMVLTAPQRVRPIDFFFPIYEDGPYSAWQTDLAFGLLKQLAPNDVPLDYQRLNRGAALEQPIVAALARHHQLKAAARFTEYQFNWPERICIDAILDAEDAGATALNYTRATLGGAQGGVRKVMLEGRGGARAQVGARRVMTMAGIWIDRVLGSGGQHSQRRIFGTKGAHIVIKLPDQYRGQGITTINSAGEPFYCIPWHDHHYIGPTETAYDGDPDDIHVDAADMEFLLSEAAALFPGLNVTRASVLRTWAGVRPLTYDPAHPKGNRSRVLHDLGDDGLEGVYAMTAAPVMSHRDAGREVTRKLQASLTPGGQSRVLHYAPRMPLENTNSPRIAPGINYTIADVRAAVQNEHARTLMGVLYRRSGTGLRHDFTPNEAASVAAVMAQELGWTDTRRDEELARFAEQTERLFGLHRKIKST